MLNGGLRMINEIEFLHRKLKKSECVRLILSEKWEISIDKTDLLKETDSGMLRIVRASGRCTAVNPKHVLMACISRKW